jgi:energy-coupling factor transporter ATP-binding protein EcfA2
VKLKKLLINGFKNLNDFEIDFTGNNGTTLLIGNNGSGKSNVLEAVSAIFTGLFKLSTPQRKPTFEYNIEYELNEIDYQIILKKKSNGDLAYSFVENNSVVLKKDFEINIVDKLPENLIALYSGEEPRLWDTYYKHLYSDFMTEVKGNFQSLPSPSLIYVNKYYWNISLLTLLYSELENNIEFCKKLLKVDSLDDVTIKFEFNQDNLTRFNNNSIVSFVQSLNLHGENAITISLQILQENHLIFSEKELFLKLMAAVMDKQSHSKLIETITINFGNSLTTELLSEGEKKQILIRTALDVLATPNSLILFDEPDSHIHVAHKGQIKYMLDEYDNRETILTTHSPTLMHALDDHLIHLENGIIKGSEKAEILKEISGDLMSITDQQIVLHSTNHILLVEGKTDIKFISEAVRILDGYDALSNVVFVPTGGASGLRLFIDKFKANEEQKIIAILDGDQAGKNEIKELLTEELSLNLDHHGYVKFPELTNTFLLMLPKPNHVENSQYEIEDFFPLEKLVEISKLQVDTFRVLKDFTLKKDFVKRKLAVMCEQNEFSASDFIEFKNLLDLILLIRNLN